MVLHVKLDFRWRAEAMWVSGKAGVTLGKVSTDDVFLKDYILSRHNDSLRLSERPIIRVY